jgi:two-component system chemotaxis response regulator CheB
MSEYPTPVVILSAYSKHDANITIKCLEAGAVGFVLKPSGELSLNIEDVKQQLIEEVKAASKVDPKKIRLLSAQKPKLHKRRLVGGNKIFIIGASTGDMQTLELILPLLPADFPSPVIVAQHVPNMFSADGLVRHLNPHCKLTVKVAEESEIIETGRIYLAPGGSHMTLNLLPNKEIAVHIKEAKLDILTPSIDLLMESAAQIFHADTIGIILTGMVCDGLNGMRTIKQFGGNTIVQDDSSLIFGMPKEIIDAGCADAILPAGEIAEAMISYVYQESIYV